jgi:hypothetical protein
VTERVLPTRLIDRGKTVTNPVLLSSLGFGFERKQIPQVVENRESGDKRKEALERAVMRPRQVRYQAALRPEFLLYDSKPLVPARQSLLYEPWQKGRRQPFSSTKERDPAYVQAEGHGQRDPERHRILACAFRWWPWLQLARYLRIPVCRNRFSSSAAR